MSAAKVDLAQEHASVDTFDGSVTGQQLAAAVEGAGYHVAGFEESAVPALKAALSAPVVSVILSPKKVPRNPANWQCGDSKGRPSPQESVLFDIGGMHCASCVGRIEQALSGVDGVLEAHANLATDQARVVFDPARASLDKLTAAVCRPVIGRTVRRRQPAHRDLADQETAAWRRRLIVGGALLVPLVVPHLWGPGPGHSGMAAHSSWLVGVQLFWPR